MAKDLAETIRNLNTNSEYDCLLMFSGGKDSSYLLYYLSQELGLRVVTFTLSHKYMAKETRENIEKFAVKYSKKHITIENDYLNHAGNHFLESWIKKPDEETLITFCTGCRLGLVKLVINAAKKEKISVVITGLTLYEATDYRVKLVNYPKGKEGTFFFFLGYLRLVLRNPSLVMDFKSLKYQAEEFYYYSNQKKVYEKNGLHLLMPFYDFLKYDEQQVIETLKKLNWQKAAVSGNSYWRADCDMNTLRQYFHKKISGYNEQEYYYGQMLKENLISKDYYESNIKDNFKEEDILKLLKSSGISEKSYHRYEKYMTKK